MQGGSASSSVARPGQTVDYAAELVVMLAPIAEQGFKVEEWTPPAIVRSFLTVKRFLDTVKAFCGLQDVNVRRAVVNQAIIKKVLFSPETTSLGDFYKFCLWLKTSDGSQVLNASIKEVNLRKKILPGQTQENVAYAAMLSEQISEFHQLIKERRVFHEKKLQELRRAVVLYQEEADADIRDIYAEYSPCPDYVELDDMELNRRCWEAFLAACRAKGTEPAEMDEVVMEEARREYERDVRSLHKTEFLAVESRREDLKSWCEEKILELSSVGDRRKANLFDPSWISQVAQWMMRFEKKLRKDVMKHVVIGPVVRGQQVRLTRRMSSLRELEGIVDAPTQGCKPKAPILRETEMAGNPHLTLANNMRIQILRSLGAPKRRAIPHARSKFETGIRKVIGGGEMLNWKQATGMYRGGGNLADAFKFLADAREDAPGRLLNTCFTVATARQALSLPCGLSVPCSRSSFIIKNFNDDATAGPLLRCFGLFHKEGLKEKLEDFAFRCLSEYADGAAAEECLPFINARVGFRTKLMELGDAGKKLFAGKPLGRCVMMLDAFEQAFSTPLYSILSRKTHVARHGKTSSFRNTIVRASSDWGRMWEEVREAAVIVELDWKKFDRERPSEDIGFIVEVILSCFEPKTDGERRFLEGHGIMLRRALLERLFITDEGGIFSIDGMVPSGSLWTGWLDTALNILYMRAVLRHLALNDSFVTPKCAGDDNLTLFWKEVSDSRLEGVRLFLNSWFRAGIEKEDYKVLRPPFFVTRQQAVFPEGTDLSKGTSKLIEKAFWMEVDGEMEINEQLGLSHRWKYVFDKKPCFLSCYWLENGDPIRPAHVNLEKLLWPEGLHQTLDDYLSALVSMAVDNPFNHHNVNHLMHRYCIAKQVQRISVIGMRPEDILWLCKFRGKEGEEVPFPMVAQWRRIDGYVDMESYDLVKRHMKHFTDFVSGVTSLYGRSPQGGLDAWRYMDMVRGGNELAESQYGNDLHDWIVFLRTHNVTKYLKPLRNVRRGPKGSTLTSDASEKYQDFLEAYRQHVTTNGLTSRESFAHWISDLLTNRQL
ncbi:TPA_asm: fusion protein [Myosoton aquaticum amalgavirus 3]|nr:TPA_asm: fusion protein [Myosoton aquaticum amalgavirus 3]